LGATTAAWLHKMAKDQIKAPVAALFFLLASLSIAGTLRALHASKVQTPSHG
jgi:hypothetical protein